MIKLESINFQHLVVCLTENYHPDDSVPMNASELAKFADPLYFEGKEIVIIASEDEDIEDLMTMIDDDDPVEEYAVASFMHRIAKEEIRAVTKLFLHDVIEGDWSAGESLVDFYNNREPKAFNDIVWDVAVHDIKTEMFKMLGR